MSLLKWLLGRKGARQVRGVEKIFKSHKAKSTGRTRTIAKPSAETKWTTFHNSPCRPDGWVRFGPTSDVAGTHHRIDSVKGAVAAMARNEEVRSDLFREPSNPDDSNAVQVYIWTKFLEGELLGYLPRDQALALARYPIAMPISCEITSIRTDGERYYVKLVVLVPAKKERVRRGWET